MSSIKLFNTIKNILLLFIEKNIVAKSKRTSVEERVAILIDFIDYYIIFASIAMNANITILSIMKPEFFFGYSLL